MNTPVDENEFYGDYVRQMHDSLKGCGLLIKVKKSTTSGIIVACGAHFFYILTVANDSLLDANDIQVTFVNGMEISVVTSQYKAYPSTNLYMLFLKHGTDEVPEMKQVKFSDNVKDIQDSVVYTLSNCCKMIYTVRGNNQYSAATSTFVGGHASILGVRDGNLNDFWHNCSLGYDVTLGSGVFNRQCEFIGMNLEESSRWTKAICLDRIKDEMVKMFPAIENMTFAEIQAYFVGDASTSKA